MFRLYCLKKCIMKWFINVIIIFIQLYSVPFEDLMNLVTFDTITHIY